MDIGKENTKYLASLLANCGATQDVINDLSFNDEVGFFESNRLADWFVSQINFGWRVWQAVKAQAVPEGFVLVSKEIPDSVVDRLRYSSYHWGDGTRDYFTPVYRMMIEAQEPTSD